jgi:hypothetical protein
VVVPCFRQEDPFDPLNEQPLKLTTMKHLFLFGCAIIILISMSCKKDSIKEDHADCANCKVTDSPTALSIQSFTIHDSNWARQGQYVFNSDLTRLIKAAGASVNELYALEVIDGNSGFQIYPCCPAPFKDGELSASVYSVSNEKTCTLTFHFPDQDMYFGEFRNSGGLPFQSIEIKVWFWK